MKNFLKTRNEEENKPKRVSSLKWKWSLIVAIAIFLTYMIFSVTIFYSFRQIMFSQEDENVKEIITGVNNRLNVESAVLTKATVYQSLSPTYTPSALEIEENFDQRNLIIGQDGNYQDTLYAEMSEEGIVVRVYSPTSRLLFESRPSDVSFNPEAKLTVQLIDINGKEGISGIAPVYSSQNGILIGYIHVTNALDDYHQMSSQIISAVFTIGVFALLFSGITGFLLASKFLQPLKTMTTTMNDIRKDTQSQSRIPLGNTNDELAHLSTVFNDMLDKMQLYIEQQKQFVEDVSHELRTPVAVMEGHLKLLNRWGKEDPEILDESLSASLQEVERMKTLVQEMLDLSRAEQVEIHYKNEKTPIKQVVHQNYNNFKMLYPNFVFNLDDDLNEEIYVSIYRHHLEQILIILLDNAVKYSTERNEVHISIASDDKFVHVAIQDFGEGMTPEDADKIFNRFYRVDKARSRHKGGNGLGLSIAKELLLGYKGNISVDSVLNHGSIFRITLPIYKETDSEL